jgi:hypothetical protein
LIFCGVIGIGMFTNTSTFLGSITLPFLDTMNLKMVLENTMNAHLSKFRLIPNSLHLIKHLFNFSRWVDKSLKIIKSSRNIFMNIIMYITKSFSYCPLINGQSIFYTKWHHNPHKSPPICYKGSFVLISSVIDI